MGVVYNPDGSVSMTGPGQTYGYSNANAGNGPMQPMGGSGGGGGDFNMNNYLDATLGNGGGTPAGSIVSQKSLGGGGGSGYSALLQSLMQQGQSGLDSRMSAYKNLMASIMGPKGLLSQMGKTGEQRIANNEATGLGQTEQDLVSRGLGNTTIRNNLLQGVHNNAETQRQSLNESLAGQKMGTSMQLFGMDPQPGYDTYLNLLSRLGGAGGGAAGGGAAGGTATRSANPAPATRGGVLGTVVRQ